MDVARQGETACDLTCGVVVAMEQIDGNSRPGQAAHLPDEEEAGPVVAPIAVIEVAGDDQEGDLLLDGKSHQPIQSGPGGGANGLCRGAFMSGQPGQGAVQVNVRGVKKAK